MFEAIVEFPVTNFYQISIKFLFLCIKNTWLNASKMTTIRINQNIVVIH